MIQQKSTSYKKGLYAEKIAAIFLFFKGYFIVAHRFKTPCGEIDLIAKRGKKVLIVEVKARNDLASAHHCIDKISYNRIMAAADIWLMQQKNPAALSLRFDVIIIRPWRWPHHIAHFME